MSDDSMQIFADEAEDLLRVAEQALLNLDDIDDAADTVNDLFRTFHTIKGAAGLFGLDDIVNFTHVVESVLGKVREGELSVDNEMVSLFLTSRDHLEQLVENALNGENSLSGSLKATDDKLLTGLTIYLNEPQAEQQDLTTVSTDTPTENNEACVINENWHISLRFGPNAFQNGMDPSSFISYLKNLGEIKHVSLISDLLPTWSEFDPESCYLGFEIELFALNTNKETIAEVFEFVLDDCRLSILPPHSSINSYIKMINKLPESDMRIGDILVACGALSELEKEDILSTQDKIVDDITAGKVEPIVPPLGEVAVESKVVEQAVVDAAIQKQAKSKKQNVAAQQTIRVNALKLESLVNLVGEMVIGSANAELNSQRLADPILSEAMENLSRLIEEVRDTTLGLRMVQIGETFNRYKRVVREVSRDLGKDIDLHISGAETELDKTLIEKIADPLMHLVRNAIDHGIESPEVRVAAGKPSKGHVYLEAFHDSGSIVIQISDDGAGLSKDKIMAKAVEKGLIQENQQLSDQDIYRLIFSAGFSTADKVSNLSGRGVGMDVVRTNIEALRGQVDINSETGKGSIITIRLPLTLAIIEGFQVRVGDSQYILPLDMVDECIELTESLHSKEDSANYINLRGEILPFMHLSDVFGTSDEADENQRDNIVVVQIAGKKAGFVVDELLGEHQTVIKPLGKVFQNLKGISGATILGSGEVAMIIDVPAMLSRVTEGSHQQYEATTIH